MHNVNFKKLVFTNFMSYGDIPNTVQFLPGLTYLNAANGYGKSTIIEALTFVLFGTSYRGGTIGDLKNTENKNSDMLTTLDFDVDFGADHHSYHIERRVKPNMKSSFSIIIDNVEQDRRATLSQKDFENRILGFNIVFFKYVVALNSQETVPFVEMKAEEKRKLIESVISVSTDKWKKCNNKVLGDSELQFDVAEKSISRITSDMQYTNGIINTLNSKKRAEIQKLRDELYELQKNSSALETKVSETEAAKKLANEAFSIYSSAQSELSSSLSELNALSGCIQKLSDIAADKKVEAELSSAVSSAEEKAGEFGIAILNKTASELNSEITKLTYKITQIEFSITSTKANISSIGKQKKDIESEAAMAKPGIPCKTCGKLSTEDDVEKIKASLRKSWRDLDDQQKMLVLNISTAETSASELSLAKKQSEDKLSDTTKKIDEYTKYVSSYLPIKGKLQSVSERIRINMSAILKYGTDELSIQKKIDEVTGIKESAEHKISELQSSSDIYQKASDEYNTAVYVRNSNNAGIDKLKSIISSEENNSDDAVMNASKQRLDELTNDLQSATENVKAFSDKISLCKYINYMCSDDGLKSYIIKLFVPYFNAAVVENLRLFDLPFDFVFDKTMKYTFYSSLGTAPEYVMLSQGQKRKVGFAIAMAFCDFVFNIADFKINCLFLDEILDISTDDKSLREMVTLVRNRVQKTPVIFAVTHRATIIQDLFDYKQNIDNNGLFSSMGTLENISENVN